MVRLKRSRFLWLLLFPVVFILLTCSKESGPTLPSFQDRENDYWEDYSDLGDGIVPYTCIPLDTQYVDEICPMGHLNPPGHPIPTQHTYWQLARTDLGAPVDGFSKPVKSPADGIITRIVFTHWAGFADYTVIIRHTNTFLTRFNHLSEISQEILDQIGSPLQEGYGGNKVHVLVNAGDVIGKTSSAYGQSAALDMGAYDRNKLNYIHPEKYPIPECHAISPLDNFIEPLQEIVFSKVKRKAEPRGGKFDFDIKGKLVGNWFLEGTNGWSGEDGYMNYLSFAYDVYDPQYLRVSLGQKFAKPGVFVPFLSRVKQNSPDFAEIGVSSGRVVYKLIPVMEGDEYLGRPLSESVSNTLLVEMISDEKIKVEVFQGDLDNPVFTGNAMFYTR